MDVFIGRYPYCNSYHHDRCWYAEGLLVGKESRICTSNRRYAPPHFSMKQLKSLKTEDGSTGRRLSITYELQSSGVSILNEPLSLSKLQCVWHWSKSQDSLNLQSIWIHIRTQPLTSLSQLRFPLSTGTTLTIIKNTNQRIYCDYCKNRYGVNRLEGQVPALWIVVSESQRSKEIKRHYCKSCINTVQHWACECDSPQTCGNHWSIGDQMKFAQQKQELPLNV